MAPKSFGRDSMMVDGRWSIMEEFAKTGKSRAVHSIL